ncbi:MAG: adenylate/guanylate cyclase domain-containing protein [Pirellulales bacterium]|nr:adenylate/guanylate cyclase domain-containing protein [Pirellulales bacterium]
MAENNASSNNEKTVKHVQEETVVMGEPAIPAAVSIFVGSKLVFSTSLERALQFGRQRVDEPEPYVRIDDRVIIAALEKSKISRAHVQLERLSNTQVRVTNTSRINAVEVRANQPSQQRHTLGPQDRCAVDMPAQLMVFDHVIQIDQFPTIQDQDVLESLPYKTLPPGVTTNSAAHLVEAAADRGLADQADKMLRGLQVTIELFQQATNEAEFLSQATKALIDVVGLETAAALRWDGEHWQTQTKVTSPENPPGEAEHWRPSRTVLRRMKEECRTFWRTPDATQSLLDVKALVAAPILNGRAEVIGALYGDRRRASHGSGSVAITEVEALLVESLASSAAAGIARLEQQKAALEARVLFEQFFTPELSRQLELQPDLLLGKDTEVTLLSCDIRRLSEVSEKLGPRLTIDWIQDVMETLSRCVSDHHGVLVDTLGDRLVGMWGAPVQRDDHPELACRAAIAMVRELPGLNRRWLSALDRPIDLGIGIHTGIVCVGNIGSASKFKYGPLGTAVRVTELAEQATGNLMVAILVTEATAERLPDDLSTRRLYWIDQEPEGPPIQLSELAVDPPAQWAETKLQYESALDAYQRGDLPTATRLLAKLLSGFPNDRASLRLLARIEQESP